MEEFEGEKLAQECGMMFMETSAKTGDRVFEAFHEIALKIYKEVQLGLIPISEVAFEY